MNLDTSIIIEGVDKSIELKNYEPYMKNLTKTTNPNQCFKDCVPQPVVPNLPSSPLNEIVQGPTDSPS